MEKSNGQILNVCLSGEVIKTFNIGGSEREPPSINITESGELDVIETDSGKAIKIPKIYKI